MVLHSTWISLGVYQPSVPDIQKLIVNIWERNITLMNLQSTVKPALETTCTKRPPALKDHCSDTAIFLKST